MKKSKRLDHKQLKRKFSQLYLLGKLRNLKDIHHWFVNMKHNYKALQTQNHWRKRSKTKRIRKTCQFNFHLNFNRLFKMLKESFQKLVKLINEIFLQTNLSNSKLPKRNMKRCLKKLLTKQKQDFSKKKNNKDWEIKICSSKWNLKK